MSLTLAAAANLAGIDKSTLRRAVKAGKLSAARDANGVWQIEACEVERLYPLAVPGGERPAAATGALPLHTPGEATPGTADRTSDVLVAELRGQLAEMRSQRDAWQAQAERLALPRPEAKQSLWRWLRTA